LGPRAHDHCIEIVPTLVYTSGKAHIAHQMLHAVEAP
jgi:hypothetical protein